MVPLIINPTYTLYSGYLLGISPFKRLQQEGFLQLGALHPNVFTTSSFRGYHSQFTPIQPLQAPVQMVRNPSTSRSTTPAATSRVRSPSAFGKKTGFQGDFFFWGGEKEICQLMVWVGGLDIWNPRKRVLPSESQALWAPFFPSFL